MPNHDIPEPFKWDDTFKVFYDSLDEEHQGLFDGVFACAEARDSKEKLSSLYEKVKTHFTNEEERMTEKNYRNLTSHKALHADFLKELEALSVPLPDDKVVYAKEWLVNHIKDIDFSYKGKLD